MREPTNTEGLMKGTVGAILLSTLGVFLVLQITLKGNDWDDVFQANPSQLVLAGGLMGSIWILDAMRINVLATALGGGLKFFNALRIALSGAFASCVTPFDTGGEPITVYLLNRQGFELGESTAIVALKSLISALSRLFLALIVPVWYYIRRKALILPKGLDLAISMGVLVYIFVFTICIFFAAYPECVRYLFSYGEV